MSKNKSGRNRRRGENPPNTGRRQFIAWGLSSLAVGGAALASYKSGLFTSAQIKPPAPTPAPLASAGTPAVNATTAPAVSGGFEPVTYVASRENAVLAADELITHYTRLFGVPSPLIHAVRGLGKGFTMADGTKAVDFLCSRFAAEKEVNGKRYIYFPRNVEVHDDSFLKAFLEAGVSLDQPITIKQNKYTLRDLGESGKALFRCDPFNLARYDQTFSHEHLPWGLIAFSILVPPAQASWTNAYGETINLPQVIDRGLAEYEASCTLGRDALARGESEPKNFHDEIKKYSCFGLHAVYGFFSCFNHGYRENQMPERMRQLFDLVVNRLQGDPGAINRDYDDAAKQGATPQDLASMKQFGVTFEQAVEVFRIASHIKFFGHAYEAINYARMHRLFPISAEQQKRIQAAEPVFYQNIVKLRAVNLEPFRNWSRQFVCDVMVALGHAARAMKLLTRENPDTLA